MVLFTIPWLKEITVKDILAAIAVLMCFAAFMKEFFGVDMIGRKIYKGAPLWWKALMKFFTRAKETDAKLDLLIAKVEKVEKQVEYNGGSSMRDAVKRIELQVGYGNQLMEIADRCSDQMKFYMGPDGACTFINDAFLRCFKWTEADVLGYSFESIVEEEDVEEMRLKWNMSINRRSKFNDEQRIKDSSGVAHKCCVKASPVISGGELVKFVGTIEIIKT